MNSYLLYIYSGTERVRELVWVQLHIGLKNVSRISRQRRGDPGNYPATKVDGTGCSGWLQPFWKEESIS